MNRLLVADRVAGIGVDGDAVEVRGGRVVGVGRAAALRRDDLAEERFPGATIVPGLRDAHVHPVPYAATLSGVGLKDASNLAEVLDRVTAAAETSSGAILGLRLDDRSLAELRLPTRWDIDAAVADRPVLLKRYCGHVAVANSAALAAGGITADTPDPAGGAIDRDEAGEPTGILRETAVDLVAPHLDTSSPVGPEALLTALRGLVGLGLTSIGAMLGLGNGPWASLGDEIDLIAGIASDLPLRVHGYVIARNVDELEDAAARLTGRGSRLRWAGLKLFADGSLGGHTAAMCRGYHDAPDETGLLRLDPDDVALARAALDMGGDVAIHAIGDRACAKVLDVFETFVDDGVDPSRLRLEHASVLTTEDIGRIADLGIVASVQPTFLGSEITWLESRVGTERLARTYPFRSLLDAGARLAGGSDCPVEPPHPLWGMALARDRAGVVPTEGLDAVEALALFTDGAAAALGEEPPLRVGSPADLVVLDVDPLTATPEELRTAAVLCSFVDGAEILVDRDRPVWRA